MSKICEYSYIILRTLSSTLFFLVVLSWQSGRGCNRYDVNWSVTAALAIILQRLLLAICPALHSIMEEFVALRNKSPSLQLKFFHWYFRERWC